MEHAIRTMWRGLLVVWDRYATYVDQAVELLLKLKNEVAIDQRRRDRSDRAHRGLGPPRTTA